MVIWIVSAGPLNQILRVAPLLLVPLDGLLGLCHVFLLVARDVIVALVPVRLLKLLDTVFFAV